MKVVAARKKLDVSDVKIDSKVMLIPTEERGFGIAAELDVTVPSMDAEQAEEIVRAAHKVCPYSNATRGNIDVAFTANGEKIDV
jgi:Ohr subfamily peroxiredoxin